MWKMATTLTVLVALTLCSGCDALSSDLLLGLLGLDGGSGGGSSDAIYFSVYNFADNSVRAEVTYRDGVGVAHTTAMLDDDGNSPIAGLLRGSLGILVEDLTTQPDSILTVTLTFPDDNNAEVTIDIRREWLPTNYRVRIGVLGPDDDHVGWFVDG